MRPVTGRAFNVQRSNRSKLKALSRARAMQDCNVNSAQLLIMHHASCPTMQPLVHEALLGYIGLQATAN